LQQTEDQKQIVAMAAQIQSLEKGRSTTMKKFDTKKGSNKKPGNRKFNKINKKNSNSKYAWLYEAPKLLGQPKDKDIKGTKLHWCPHHGEARKWVKHTLANCKVRKDTSPGEEVENSRYHFTNFDYQFLHRTLRSFLCFFTLTKMLPSPAVFDRGQPFASVPSTSHCPS
jgi:hypothetical protein